MPRFVILHHQLPPESPRRSHYDLLLDTGELLSTWAMDTPPNAHAPVQAQKLPDHRRAYLDYEGPVSGNRGMVSRYEAGTYDTVSEDEDRLVISIAGQHLHGQLIIARAADGADTYRVSFSPASGKDATSTGPSSIPER